jgi:hypothetical protein
MCIVVDINTLAPVFCEECDKHPDFRPVKEWIEKRLGFIVFGGSTYKKELQVTYRYLRLFRQLKDSGQAIAICDKTVDEAEALVKIQTNGSDCDDQHIIALLGVSRCPLLCSNDVRSYKYISDKSLYPKGMARVKIYSSARNRVLLKPISCNILKNQV